jgi:hypothetical protein
LKVAGATNRELFSPGAVDYIFRCSAGIPRNINNLCDNALLNGFASGTTIISRAIIEQIARTFDMLPRNEHGPVEYTAPAETTARIFNSSARAELWAAGDGNGNTGVSDMIHSPNALPTHGNGNGNSGNGGGNGYDLGRTHDSRALDEKFSLVSPAPDRDFAFDYSRRTDPLSSLSAPASTTAYSFDSFSSDPLTRMSGTDPFGRGNNGQSL